MQLQLQELIVMHMAWEHHQSANWRLPCNHVDNNQSLESWQGIS